MKMYVLSSYHGIVSPVPLWRLAFHSALDLWPCVTAINTDSFPRGRTTTRHMNYSSFQELPACTAFQNTGKVLLHNDCAAKNILFHSSFSNLAVEKLLFIIEL